MQCHAAWNGTAAPQDEAMSARYGDGLFVTLRRQQQDLYGHSLMAHGSRLPHRLPRKLCLTHDLQWSSCRRQWA